MSVASPVQLKFFSTQRRHARTQKQVPFATRQEANYFRITGKLTVPAHRLRAEWRRLAAQTLEQAQPFFFVLSYWYQYQFF